MKEKCTNPFLFKKRGVVCGERISTSLTLKKNKYLSLGESVSVRLLQKNRIIITQKCFLIYRIRGSKLSWAINHFRN